MIYMNQEIESAAMSLFRLSQENKELKTKVHTLNVPRRSGKTTAINNLYDILSQHYNVLIVGKTRDCLYLYEKRNAVSSSSMDERRAYDIYLVDDADFDTLYYAPFILKLISDDSQPYSINFKPFKPTTDIYHPDYISYNYSQPVQTGISRWSVFVRKFKGLKDCVGVIEHKFYDEDSAKQFSVNNLNLGDYF